MSEFYEVFKNWILLILLSIIFMFLIFSALIVIGIFPMILIYLFILSLVLIVIIETYRKLFNKKGE